MSKLAGLLVILVLAVLVGGGVFLATFNLPPPSAVVQKVIPDARLPH